jgi:hypothetical protein
MRDMEESMAVKAPGLITLLQPTVHKSQLVRLVEEGTAESVERFFVELALAGEGSELEQGVNST